MAAPQSQWARRLGEVDSYIDDDRRFTIARPDGSARRKSDLTAIEGAGISQNRSRLSRAILAVACGRRGGQDMRRSPGSLVSLPGHVFRHDCTHA